MIGILARFFKKKQEPKELTPYEKLDAVVTKGIEIEDELSLFSVSLADLDFKKDYLRSETELNQLVEWNTRANFAYSSLLDELKIMYQERHENVK